MADQGVGNHIVTDSVMARVRSRFESLRDSEQQVAVFIEQYPDDFVHLPVRELAERIGVSDATIIRCCRALGYEGLRALKLALAGVANAPLQVLHEDVAPNDAPDEIIRKVLLSDIQAIADTIELLEVVAFGEAVEALLVASRIEFYGIGSSMPITLDAYYRFLRIGLPVTVATDPHMQAVSAALLPPGAVAFAISHTGRTRETLGFLQKARAAGATCILLSSHGHTPLSKLAHIELVTGARETAYRTEALSSRIAHLSVIDALYVAVAARRSGEALAALAKTNAIVAEHRLE